MPPFLATELDGAVLTIRMDRPDTRNALHHRLMEPLGYLPPAEFEANYHRQRAGQDTTV